ncbi:Wuschel-related homeobox [Asimina triloba]
MDPQYRSSSSSFILSGEKETQELATDGSLHGGREREDGDVDISGWRGSIKLQMESDQRADKRSGGVVHARDSDAKRRSDTADNQQAQGLWTHRREERLLLVSESQGQAEAETEAGKLALFQSLLAQGNTHPASSASHLHKWVSPYFIPNAAVGFYPQYPKVPLPGASPGRPRRSSSEEKSGEKPKKNGCDGYEFYLNPVAETPHDDEDIDSVGRETLQLFPLHPTGILEDRRPGNATTAATPTTVTCNNDLSFSSDEREKEIFNSFAGESQ